MPWTKGTDVRAEDKKKKRIKKIKKIKKFYIKRRRIRNEFLWNSKNEVLKKVERSWKFGRVWQRASLWSYTLIS